MNKNWEIVLFALILPAAAYWLITRIFPISHDGREVLAGVLAALGTLVLIKRHG